jgi:uncharacterized protein
LEESNCVGARSGWRPQFLRIEHEDGSLAGAVPAYLKSHSQGEYVFDYAWADAFARAGGSYYPKLQISAPFTPVTGPRLLTTAGQNTEITQSFEADSISSAVRQLGISSAS